MKKLLPHLLFIAFFFFLLPRLYAQSNQIWTNGQTTTPVNFTGSCTYTWTNSNPSIGLPASGTGNIPAFTAINTGNTAVTATIMATPPLTGFAYIANGGFGVNSVSVINVATNEVTTTIPVGANPLGVTVNHAGNLVYVGNSTGSGSVNSISVISTVTNKVLATIPINLSYGPIQMVLSPDDSKLYVACNSNIIIFNTSTNSIIATIPAGANITEVSLAISPDGSRLYVSDGTYNDVLVINTSNYATIDDITIGYNPYGIALSTDGSRLYVPTGIQTITNPPIGNLNIINTVNDAILATIPVGQGPSNVVLSTDGSRAYVANEISNSVSVINTASYQVVATITVGEEPYGLSSTADGSEIFALNALSNNVSVINTTTNTVTATIATGTNPQSFGNFITSGLNCGGPITFTITVEPTIPPTITTTAPTGTISACVGTPSADPNVEQFNASGTNLTGDITVMAPTGFEVSRDIDGSYSSSLTLTQTSGSVGNSQIFVRSAATAPAGNISPGINVTLSSQGATDQIIQLNGTINAIPLVNTPPSQEVANGATTTTVSFTGTANTYTWSNNNTGIGLAANGTGNILSFTAVNTGSSKVTATVTVTPSNTPLAYIENNGDNSISIINAATQKVINTKSFTTPTNGNFSSFPNTIAVSPNGQRVYIGEQANNTVVVYNTTTNSPVVSIPVPAPMGICVSPDNTTFYVASNIYRGVVYVYNAGTNALVTTITVGNFPVGMIMSPDGSKLYVADSGNSYASNAGSDNIDVISTLTNKVTNTFPVNGYPNWLAISPDGNTLYATDILLNNLYVINTTTGGITNTITMNFEPYAIAISPDGSRVYVANQNTNSLSVINTATNRVIATVNVGDNPSGISITNDGNELYVVNNGSGTVSVINTANNMVTATIPVGKSPTSYGNFISPGGCPGSPVPFTIKVDPAVGATITATAPTGTISACVGTPSADPNVEQFNASGANLTGDITVMAPTGFEVSRDIDGSYSSSLTLTQTSGSVGSSLVYVRSAATAPAGNISPGINVTLSSQGATDQTVVLSGIIYAIPSANTPASQLKVNGSTTDPVIFTGNASSYTWVNNNTSIGLAASGAGNILSFTAINNTGSPIIATITVTPVNGADCGGSPDEFYITVDPTPTVLTVAGILAPLTTVYGTASPGESFTVSCTTIGAQILVTPPAGFEVSSDGTTFSSTITITSNESNSPVTVYIRLAATTHAGNNYGGNVTVSADNAADATITMPVSVVTPALLTITADNKTKPYDAANPPLTATYTGFVNKDGPAQLTALPVLTTIATTSSAVGLYVINVNGGSSHDYTFAYNAGVLTITPALALQDIPNTFTPNGDGRNDTWVIKGLEYYPAATVNIFNRWGQKLYYSVGYPIPWDGTYHGKELPSGTYYFIIDLKNKQPLIAGWVAIIR